MSIDITRIPDYAALKKLASALWQQNNSYHGAAIMIGSGFSRCVATCGDSTKKLPLWADFSKILSDELQSNTADPLRLAEEYCAFFGQQSLNDLIRKNINDKGWQPGELHEFLLKLPWADVLTTNWDTLLERTSETIHERVYSVVSKQDDLSSARAPRIVKLHGTIDVSPDFVFTQEDYRKYPQRYAAFVNFARQVFIENELCLLGFSGDDPNFLQWAGWVRDHLSNHARRIYLVGALNLNSAKRKYLESINVAPIDFYSLVAEYSDHDRMHYEATKLFIEEIKRLRPKKAWEWQPIHLQTKNSQEKDYHRQFKDHQYAAKLLEDIVPILTQERLSYPGWLICPPKKRVMLARQITAPWPNSKNLAAMDEAKKALLLYEISWRHQVTFDLIEPWLAQELIKVCDVNLPSSLNKLQQLDIALTVLKNTRWMDPPDSERFASTALEMLINGTKFNPELNCEIAHYRALVAKDQFDYQTMEDEADKIVGTSPMWKIKKAALLAEIGQFKQFDILLREAYKELLLQWRNDRNSVYVLSRLAWARWLVQATSMGQHVDQLPTIYREAECDPWLHIEHSQERINTALNKQKQDVYKPHFQPGHYIDGSHTTTLTNEVHPLIVLDGMVNSVGIPLRWQFGTFIRQQIDMLTEFHLMTDLQRFSLAIRSASDERDDILNNVFSRLQIARLSERSLDLLLINCKNAINYFSKKLVDKTAESFNFYCSRLQVFCEILGRLSVRTCPDNAIEIFRLGISLGQQKSHQVFGLGSAIKHLVEFSLSSIPSQRQNEVLLDALSFPLDSEIANQLASHWGNPVIEVPLSRVTSLFIDRRLEEIIDQIDPKSDRTAAAILRLLPLIKSNFLTANECLAIQQKLWPGDVTSDSLPNIGIVTSALLLLPTADFAAVQAKVRQYLFAANETSLINQYLLQDLVHAAQNACFKELPSESQAIVYFNYLVAWRAPESSSHRFIDAFNDLRHLSKQIGKVLYYSVTPSLEDAAFNEDNFEKLISFIDSVDSPPALGALTYFAVANSKFAQQAELRIRKSLHSGEAEAVSYASFALLTWHELQSNFTTERLVSRLIHLIGVNQMACGLPALLWTANQLYIKGYLAAEQVSQLNDIIPFIFDSSNYNTMSFSNREEVTVSLVRAACIKLAKDIVAKEPVSNLELNRIIEEAKRDPLPEVRFAEGLLAQACGSQF